MNSKDISFVRPNSYAEQAGIKPSDVLLSVNGQDFNDIIDLSFLFADEYLEFELLTKEDERKFVEIEKNIDDDLGIEFSHPVFDNIRECHNNCLFCFVDQMAPNMRDTLYIKDDDYRLSFLNGSFITLTNITQEDKNRILALNLSPLYVSVHATDETVRGMLMKNKFAGSSLSILKELGEQGIKFHTQLVLCPDVNDGKILEKSYHDLLAMSESVLSVAVVPVGLTKFCKNNEKVLRPFHKSEAEQVVEQISKWQYDCRNKLGRSFIYVADEFYVKAEKDFPSAEFYDGFGQYENGIGICRIFIDEWNNTKVTSFANEKNYCIVCGWSAEKILHDLVASKANVLAVPNDFFGHSVTVTGLLTGEDIVKSVNALKNKPDCVIIPGVTLKSKAEQVFLDDMTIGQLELAISCKVKVIYDAIELKKELAC